MSSDPQLPARKVLDENAHPPPLTLADMEDDVVIRGFAFALTRHLQAFHVLTAGSGVWSTEPPPCETPLFSERATRFYLPDDPRWAMNDRTPPPSDVGMLIEVFVRQVYKGVDLEPPVLVYALVLIERFARCAGEIRGTVRMHTLRPLVVTALIIACKLYFDEDVYVGDFSRLALGDDARAISPLVRCEIAFLRHISYVLVVRPRTFAQYFHAMRSLVRVEQAAAQQAYPGSHAVPAQPVHMAAPMDATAAAAAGKMMAANWTQQQRHESQQAQHQAQQQQAQQQQGQQQDQQKGQPEAQVQQQVRAPLQEQRDVPMPDAASS